MKDKLEQIVSKGALFIDTNGVTWQPELHYFDGYVALTLTCVADKDNEFIFYPDEDEIKEINGNLLMNGLNELGSNDTLNGKFYIPYSI